MLTAVTTMLAAAAGAAVNTLLLVNASLAHARSDLHPVKTCLIRPGR